MFTEGQIIPRSEVEQWVREAFQFPHFIAKVTEKEVPIDMTKDRLMAKRPQTRVRLEITGPNGETIVAGSRSAVYWSFKDSEQQMPQVLGTEWAA